MNDNLDNSNDVAGEAQIPVEFLQHLNPTPHLNRAKVKQTALDIAANTRAQGFTRVGASFLQRIEAATLAAIRNEVRMHPSKGKTLL